MTAAALVLVVAAIPATASTQEEHAQISNGRIAFVSGTHLFTIKPSGGGRRQLTTGLGLDDEPAWSLSA